MRIPFTHFEIRSLRRPRPDAWDDFWYTRQGGDSLAGIKVTEDTALKFSAVWACVKVISEDLASLPLFIYERSGASKERRPEHPLYSLLHDAPNEEMTAMQFREAMQAHLLLWGNCFAQIQRNMRGEPMALWPLHPGNMEIKRDINSRLLYRYRLPNTAQYVDFDPTDIFHVAGLGFNGVSGYSVINYQREAIGVGLAAQEFQGSNFKNGARLSMALVHPAPKAPSAEGRKQFREELAKEYAGAQNAGKIGVFWEGMEPKPMSMSMKDAEFIASLKQGRVEIASIFRVPPHKIMDLDRATFSNIEQQDIDYVKSCIRPWAVRWEQAINQRLLDASPQHYAEHLLDGLMRGDILSRYRAYVLGRQWGWLSINEIRDRENMNPVDGGDVRLQPLNMAPLGTLPDPAQPADEPITDEEKEEAARALRQLRLIRG